MASTCPRCDAEIQPDDRFCPTCGVQPFSYGAMPDGTKMAAINVRCLEGFDLENVVRKPVNGREF